MATATVWKMPCLRILLGDAEVHRKGEYFQIYMHYLTSHAGALSFPNGLGETKIWDSKRTHRVSLYNVGTAGTNRLPGEWPRLEVLCRRFLPSENDPLSKDWNGGRKKFSITPFAIPPKQIAETSKNLDALLDKNYDMLVAELQIGQDDIVCRSLAEASRNAKLYVKDVRHH